LKLKPSSNVSQGILSNGWTYYFKTMHHKYQTFGTICGWFI